MKRNQFVMHGVAALICDCNISESKGKLV